MSKLNSKDLIGFKLKAPRGPQCNSCSNFSNKTCSFLGVKVKGSSVCIEKYISKSGESYRGQKFLYDQFKKKNRKGCNKTAKKSFPNISNGFYSSREWRALRVKVLVEQGRKCCLCGRTPKDGIILHVDHIKPRSKYPELELKKSNLQILCEDCNMGKSNKYEEDWR